MIKMVVEVWRRPDLSFEQFSKRWRTEHAALVRKHAKAMGFVRYVQSHKTPSAAVEAFAEGRGWKPAPDGITELWWESEESMNAAMSSPEGQAGSAALEIDEGVFCDSRRLSAFLSVEHEIFNFSRD